MDSPNAENPATSLASDEDTDPDNEFDYEVWLKGLEHDDDTDEADQQAAATTGPPENVPSPSGQIRPASPTSRLLAHAAIHRDTLAKIEQGHGSGWFTPSGTEARVLDALVAAASDNPTGDYAGDALVALDEPDAWALYRAIHGLADDPDQRQQHTSRLIALLQHRHWYGTTFKPAVAAIGSVGDGSALALDQALAAVQRAVAERPGRAQDRERFLTFGAARLGEEPAEYHAICHTGFTELDDLLGWETVDARNATTQHRGGLRQGALTLVCAPSGWGKTTLSLEMMARAHRARWDALSSPSGSGTYRAGLACMMFSGEMTPSEILDRWGLVDPARRKHRSKNRWWAYRHFELPEDVDWLAEPDETDFFVVYKHDARAGVETVWDIIGFVREYVASLVSRYQELLPSATAQDQTGQLRRSVLVRLPMVVCVDYLDAWLIEIDNRPVESEKAALALKHYLCLGKAFQGLDPVLSGWRPLVLLNVQTRLPDRDKRGTGAYRWPTLDDLNWCKAVKNHADVALMLHRPDIEEHRESEEAHIVVAKSRFSKLGSVPVRFKDGLIGNARDSATWRGYAPAEMARPSR